MDWTGHMIQPLYSQRPSAPSPPPHPSLHFATPKRVTFHGHTGVGVGVGGAPLSVMNYMTPILFSKGHQCW